MMRSIIFFSFLCFFGCLYAQPKEDYARIFGQKHRNAVMIVQQNKALITQVCTQYDEEVRLAISMVFPEMLRYNAAQDWAETSANRLFYVNYGGSYGNFSIGYFQMKPEFIEQMEAYIAKIPALRTQFATMLTYATTTPEDIRKARIHRLSQLEWQLTYVCAFRKIVAHKFPHRPPTHAQLPFYAAAYNHGFIDSDAHIATWINKRAFPDGPHFSHQFRFTDIAMDTYAQWEKIWR